MKNGNRQPAHALALALVLCMALAAAGCGEAAQETAEFSYAEVPAYADAAYAEINGNVPYFTESDITLDTSNYTLSCGQKSVSLGAKEYEIMRMFLSNPTQVISKDAIISKVWGLDVDITENNVEAYMSFLRKKLFFIGSKLTIMTKRLLGYYLEKESD